MDRRHMLKQSSFAIAGIVSLPGLSVLLQSCKVENTGGYKPIFLSEEEYQTVWAIAEAVLPTTETPGANDAGVAPYIDLLFGTYFDKEVSVKHKSQLNSLMNKCQQTFGLSFPNLNTENQYNFLDALDSDEDGFFRYLKNLMLWAFFTSEQGMKSMDYNPVPGKYEGCIHLEGNTNNRVGNATWILTGHGL